MLWLFCFCYVVADSENKACLTNNVQCGLYAAAETQEQP